MAAMDKGWCLVLSGGGAKGVYHIGVWRALKELGIKVDAFVGASIGAIIAGFLAQGADDALEDLGSTINVDSILALPEELTEGGELKLDKDSLLAARELFRSLQDNHGLDTSPLRKILASRLNEEAMRESGKNLGIVTVNISDLQPREVWLEDMEAGKLVDYLMASAAFPGFEQPVIAGKKYVDGGIHDNIPYGMARRRGYRQVIISDISGAGRNRKPEIEGSVTAYVKNSIDMGGILDFDRGFLDDFTLLGYLDTMRTFGRFGGHYYFVEENSEAEEGFSSRSETWTSPDFPAELCLEGSPLLAYLECAARILEVPRVRAYSYDDLEAAIGEKRLSEDERISELLGKGGESRSGIVAAVKDAVANRSFSNCPYHYLRLVEEIFPNKAGALLEKALMGIWPELPAGLSWLRTSRS